MRKRWLPELMAQYKYGETKQPFYKSNPYRLDNVKILAKYINPNVEVVALKSNNIGYSKEVCFDDCKDKSYLRFDYQLDINDGLIEVDGEQHFHVNRFGMGMSEEEKIEHFKMIQKHDRIKENYCKENGIKFLRISYKEILNNSFKEKILEFVA